MRVVRGTTARTGLGLAMVGVLMVPATVGATSRSTDQGAAVGLPPIGTTSTARPVQVIETSELGPPSPDPAGVAHLPGTDELLVVDSEVDEVTGAGHDRTNVWFLGRTGGVNRTSSTLAWTIEPTGVDHDPAGARLFVSDDDRHRIHVVKPGADGRFATGDDQLGFIDTASLDLWDTEDPAFDPGSGDLFFVGGTTTRVFRVDPGNGTFGDDDDVVTSFDVGRFGIRDAEALAHDPARDTLVVGDRLSATLVEVTRSGQLVRTIDLGGVPGLRYVSGLEIGPRSSDPNQLSYWIADRGRDNDNHPDENDGRVIEVARAAVPAERLAGTDRVHTAVRISAGTFPSADTVVLARADTYPDALAGAPLAARLGGPVLLSAQDRLSAATRSELQRLGARRAVLLGGPAALSDAVRADVEGLGLSVERLAGTDRFDTAARVAARVGGQRVYVTQGISADPNRGWPDAVAVSALAAFQGAPILLTRQESLPAATSRALTRLGVTRATVVGGPMAVSGTVERQLAATGAQVDRVSGSDRYETSARLASRAAAAGLSANRPWLATGLNFPDALTAGPAAAAAQGVLLLVHGQSLSSSGASRSWLQRQGAELTRLLVVGGGAAVSEQTAREAELLIEAVQAGAR